MNTRPHLAGIIVVLCSTCAGAAPLPDHGNAGDRCEAAVAETIKRMRGREAQEVEFFGAKRALSPSPGDETGVKGEGRYRGPGVEPVAFTYSCAFNRRSGETSGVVFREAGTAHANADKPWQPDLTQFSPDACEAATAAALKEKYPRVARIAFGSDTRELQPAPNEHTRLVGQGAVEPAPGMNSIPFTYRCEFESHGGKVVDVRTSD